MSHGGTDIGDAPQNASPGDPVFYGNIGNLDHVQTMIQTGAAPDGTDTLIDAHNVAEFHAPYTSGTLAIHIVHLTVNNPASPSVGSVSYATPSWVGQNSDSRLEAFRLGNDGASWHVWQTCVTCGWSSWSALGTPSSSVAVFGQPVVIRNKLNSLEVFVEGSDEAIWHIWQTSSGCRGGHRSVGSGAVSRRSLSTG